VGFHFIPPEEPGPIRSLPFDQLVTGEYDTAKVTDVANAPRLSQVLKELQADIASRPELAGGHAVLVIEDWQGGSKDVNLKKVTLRILWDKMPVANGVAQPYENTVYVHRDSNYGE
jgi:hypothetical protein